jgi:hypothetical protein
MVVGGQGHAVVALLAGKRPDGDFVAGCVGFWAELDGIKCGQNKFRTCFLRTTFLLVRFLVKQICHRDYCDGIRRHVISLLLQAFQKSLLPQPSGWSNK